MDIAGLFFGLGAIVFVGLLIPFTLLAPIFWVWMLVDAILREEWEYPGASGASTNRLIWVVVIAIIQIAAVPYFFMVYNRARRGSMPRPY